MESIKNNYIFSDESDYVYVDDDSLGLIKIYLPSNGDYSIVGNDIVNEGSSNLTGYVNLDNGESLTITFQPFSEGRYRIGGTTSQYSYLSINEILEVKRAVDFEYFSMVMFFFILLYMLLGGVMRVFSK